MTATEDNVERGVSVAGGFGLVARGVAYCLLGVVALQVASGQHNREVNRQGALRLLARQPFGAWLLVALTIGFVAYAVWRFAEAAVGDHEVPSRLLHAARGALYIAFAVGATRLVLGRGSNPSSDDQAKTWSARVMAHQGGRVLVIAVGVGLTLAGAVLAWRGAHRRFEKHLRVGEMRGWQRRWFPWLGTVGHAARGAVLSLIGLFLVRSGVRFDPQEAVGVDGALHQLADRPYGTLALVAVAVGLMAFGLFSFVEARWRQVLDS